MDDLSEDENFPDFVDEIEEDENSEDDASESESYYEDEEYSGSTSYETSSSTSSESSDRRYNINQPDESWADITSDELLNNDYIESFHKKLVSKGRVNTEKKKENMRRKERKLSEQLEAADLIAGLHPQDNQGDTNNLLRSLLSARRLLLFPSQSANKDKMVKRIDVLKHVIRASMEKAQKEAEAQPKLNKPFATGLSSHVEIGIRTALNLGMMLLKTMARTTPDLLVEVIDMFGDTFSKFPALCIRDPSNFELDVLYRDVLTGIRGWLLQYLEMTQDDVLRKKIVKTLFTIAFASGTLEDLVAILTGLLSEKSAIRRTFPLNLTQELKKLHAYETEYLIDVDDLIGKKALCWPELTDSSPAEKNLTTMTTEGDYLYVHDHRGLLKVGTGYGPIRLGEASVYKKDYRTAEKGWLVYLQGKLYYRSPEIKPASLLVLNKDTLEEEYSIIDFDMDNTPLGIEDSNNRTPVITDGRYLYKLSTKKQGTDNQLVVDMYDLDTGVKHLKHVEFVVPGGSISMDSVHFITNGIYIALVTTTTENVLFKLFSLRDPTAKVKDTFNSWGSSDWQGLHSICFDHEHSMLWSYCNSTLRRFLNIHLSPENSSSPASYLQILASPEMSVETDKEFTAEQTALFLLSHIARVSRECHFSLKEASDFDVIEMPFLIQVDENHSTLKSLCGLAEEYIQKYVNGTSSKENLLLDRYLAFILLKFIKLNIMNFCQSAATIGLISDATLLDRLRTIVTTLANCKPPVDQSNPIDIETHILVKDEAAELVAVGIIMLELPSQSELILQCVNQLEDNNSSSILEAILLRFSYSDPVKIVSTQDEIIVKLVDFAEQYTTKLLVLANNNNTQNLQLNVPSKLEYLSIEFLLSYVKHLLQGLLEGKPENTASLESALNKCCNLIIKKGSDTLQLLSTLCSQQNFKHEEITQLLGNSLVSKIIPYLVIGLSGSVEDLKLISEVTVPLLKLLHSLDEVNRLLPPAPTAEKSKDKKEETTTPPLPLLLDVQSTLTWMLGKYASSLIIGNSVPDKEKECAPFLSSSLLAKGLGKPGEEEDSFLKDFMEGTSEETTELFNQVRAAAVNPTELQLIKRISDPSIEKAEKSVIAALLKHNGLIALAMFRSASLKHNQSKETEGFEELVPLWRTAYKLRKWLIQEHQLTNQSYEQLSEKVISKANLLLKIKAATTQSPHLTAAPEPPSPMKPSLRTSSSVTMAPSWKITVNTLRSWADFFNIWKSRTYKSAQPNISDEVFNFIKSNVSAESLTEVMLQRQMRAQYRAAGLTAFEALLATVSVDLQTHEILSHIIRGIRGSDESSHELPHHFLQDLESTGEDNLSNVSEQFKQLVSHLLGIMNRSDTQETTYALKHLALDVLNLDFKSRDIPLLKDLSVLPILLGMAIQDDSSLLRMTPNFKISSPRIDLEGRIKDTGIRASDSYMNVLDISTTSIQSEKMLEMKPKERLQRQLQKSAWICFRLLSLKCIEVDETGTMAEEIFKLLDAPLTRAEKYFFSIKKGKEDWVEPQTEKILLLLNSIATNAKAIPYLSQIHRIRQLISLIKHGSLRIKLLSIRLLRQSLLAKSDPTEFEHLIIDEKTLLEFFFELIGIAYATSSTVFTRKMALTVRLTHDTVAIASEAIMLIRKLMTSSQPWRDYISSVIRDSLRRIPSLVEKNKLAQSAIPDQESIWNCMASVCIIGGDIDCLRLGARVISETKARESEVTYETGTVVDFDILWNKAKIVLDNQTPIQPIEKQLTQLTAVPEVVANPSAFELTKNLIPLFKLFLSKDVDTVLFMQFKSRILKVLINALEHEPSLELFTESNIAPSLRDLALTLRHEKFHLNLEQMEKVSQTLQDLLLAEKSTISVSLALAPKKPFIQKEIDKLISRGIITQAQYRELRLEFAQLDLNGDGEVTVEEFKEANRRRGVPLSQEDIESIKKGGVNEGKPLDFIKFASMILGKEITPPKKDDTENTNVEVVPQLEVKNPIQLSGSYEIEESSCGAKLNEFGIHGSLIEYDEFNPYRVAGRIVILKSEAELDKILPTCAEAGVIGVVIIVQETGDINLDFKENHFSFPILLLQQDSAKELLEYLRGSRREKKDFTPLEKMLKVNILVDLGYSNEQAEEALSECHQNVNIATSWLNRKNVKEDKKTEDKDKSKQQKPSKKSKKDSEEEFSDEEDNTDDSEDEIQPIKGGKHYKQAKKKTVENDEEEEEKGKKKGAKLLKRKPSKKLVVEELEEEEDFDDEEEDDEDVTPKLKAFKVKGKPKRGKKKPVESSEEEEEEEEEDFDDEEEDDEGVTPKTKPKSSKEKKLNKKQSKAEESEDEDVFSEEEDIPSDEEEEKKDIKKKSIKSAKKSDSKKKPKSKKKESESESDSELDTDLKKLDDDNDDEEDKTDSESDRDAEADIVETRDHTYIQYFTNIVEGIDDSSESESEIDSDDDSKKNETEKKDKKKLFDPSSDINMKNPQGEVLEVEYGLSKLYARQSIILFISKLSTEEGAALFKDVYSLLEVLRLAACSSYWISARTDYRPLMSPVLTNFLLKNDQDNELSTAILEECIGHFLRIAAAKKAHQPEYSLKPNLEFAIWLLEHLLEHSQNFNDPVLYQSLVKCFYSSTQDSLRVSEILIQLLQKMKDYDKSKLEKLKKRSQQRYEHEKGENPVLFSKYLQANAEILATAKLTVDPPKEEEESPIKEIYIESLTKSNGTVKNKLECDGTYGFSSFIAKNVCLSSGKYYYEATLGGDAIAQIGWATNDFKADPDNSNGVGDDAAGESWSYDANRCLRWTSNRSVPYSTPHWRTGDTVGCLLNLDKREMRFSLNGQILEKAFEGFSVSLGLTPACSLSQDMKLTFQFARGNLKYLPSGYKPVTESREQYPTWFTAYNTFFTLTRCLYTRDTIPSEIWNAVMDRFSKTPIQDAKAAISIDWSSWTLSMDETLVELSQSKNSFATVASNDSILAEIDRYPSLKEQPLPSIKYRLLLLLFLNDYARTAVQFINLDQASAKWSLAHTFTKIKGLLFFDMKRKLLQKVVKATENLWSYPKTVQLNRLLAFKQRERGYQNGNELDSLYGQMYSQLIRHEKDDPKFWFYTEPVFKTDFKGEGGTDQGGLYNEALSQICTELQSNTLSLFINVPNGQHNVGLNRDKYIPRSTSNSATQLSMYTLLGKLIGSAMRNDHPLALNFPSLLWKPLVGETPTVQDLKDIDVMCTNILDALRNIDKEKDINPDDFESYLFNEFFTTLASDGRELELKPGGKSIPATFSNRLEWADLVEKARVNEFKPQWEALRNGLASVLPISMLTMFTWKELEILATGNPVLDIEKLKKNTTYSGYTASSSAVKTFWKVLESFTPEDQSLFLRFTWGRNRLPDNLTTQFSLRTCHVSGNVDQTLPQSHTCMFALDLPDYSSFEAMKKKLLYAIRECQAIDTDFNVNNADMWE